MPTYELHVLGADNRTMAVKTISSNDDAEAFEMARRYLDGHAIELWEGKRFIATLEKTSGRPSNRLRLTFISPDMIRLSATHLDAHGHRWAFVIEVDGRVHTETSEAKSVAATLKALDVQRPEKFVAHACRGDRWRSSRRLMRSQPGFAR